MKIEERTIYRIAQIVWGISWFFAFLLLFMVVFGIELHISPYWSVPVSLLIMGSFEVMEIHSEWLEEYWHGD